MKRKTGKTPVTIALGILLSYALFLMILPSVVSYFVPCLNAFPTMFEGYEYHLCNLDRVLNIYTVFMLMGIALAVTLWFAKGKHSRLPFHILIYAVLTASAISAYYLYLPYAETGIRNAPVFTDSIIP